MALNSYNETINTIANKNLESLENYFELNGIKADILFYCGEISAQYEQKFRHAIEGLASKLSENLHDTLIIILQTYGGSAETTEKFVNIMRKYYKNVFFIVPNYAMSAGTIWCMSGNKIFMDYSSCLGPIDPQIFSAKEQRMVPANGYIDEFDNMIQKSLNGTLSNAEFVLLQNQDIGFINSCRQQKELTKNLLLEWLVKYKFRDWTETRDRHLQVTDKMKKQRAQEIAQCLADNTKWNIHSRPIMLHTLQNDINLIIEDYTDNQELKNLIRQYVDFVIQCMAVLGVPQFIHTREYM